MSEPQKSVLTEMASNHERLLSRITQNDALANLIMFTIVQVLLECTKYGKMLDDVKFDDPHVSDDKMIYQFWFSGNGKMLVRPPLQRSDSFVQFQGRYNRAMSEALRHDEFIRLFNKLVERFDNFALQKMHKLSDVDIEKAGLFPDRTFFAQLSIRKAHA
jgi:hypothetical protein